MSLPDFESRIAKFPIRSTDKTWFPRWLKRYATFLSTDLNQKIDGNIPVSQDRVLKFLRSIRDSGTPAWRRLQAVNAIDCYKKYVLQTDEPKLDAFRIKLSEIADRESSGKLPPNGVPIDEREIAGVLNPAEDPVIQQLRKKLRTSGKAWNTEKAYVSWVRRLAGFANKDSLLELDESDIKAFLTDLAVEKNVAPRTQNQAKAAILFLYQNTLGRQLEFLDIATADKPEKLPVVLTRQEISTLIRLFHGEKKLMFLLMYGAGLRHAECRRLRIKDLDVEKRTLYIRDGKGGKDRVSVLPEIAVRRLHEQIESVRRHHERDCQKDFAGVHLPYAIHRKYPNAAKSLVLCSS